MRAYARLAALTALLVISPGAFADDTFLLAGTGSNDIGQGPVLDLSNGGTVTLATGQALFTPGPLNQEWWRFDNANYDTNDSIYLGDLQPDPLDPVCPHRNFFTFSLDRITPGSSISAVLPTNRS